MIAMTPTRTPERPNRSRRRPRVPRKPDQARFEALRLHLPSVSAGGVPWPTIAVAVLMVSGILAGVFWPQHAQGHGEQYETFVMEEEKIGRAHV